MTSDERQIRALTSAWLAATRERDVETILGLMTDDVVFLTPGQPPMIGKTAFAAAAKGAASQPAPQFDAAQDIQEIQIFGDVAFMWAKLAVTVTPPHGGVSNRRAGHTLSVFTKQDGRWLLARDANMLAPVAAP